MPITARPIGKTILLTIVTLGIYSLYWVYKTHDELKAATGEGLGGGIGLLLYVLVGPVTWFVLPNEVEKAAAKAGKPSEVKATTGFWLLLPIIGMFIWYPKVQRTLNSLSNQPVPA